MRRNGTEPIAKPIGTPCRKYNSTSSKKFRLSCTGKSLNVVPDRPGVRGVGGGSSSKVKSDLFITLDECVDVESIEEASFLRISMCECMSPFAWPLARVATFRSCRLERRLGELCLRVIGIGLFLTNCASPSPSPRAETCSKKWERYGSCPQSDCAIPSADLRMGRQGVYRVGDL